MGILIVSFFLPSREVGIFSFAAIFAEGFNQLLMVLRNNVNPILSKHSANKDELKKVIGRGVKLTYIFTFVLGLVSIALYPLVIYLFVNQDFMTSWPVFAVLIGGIMLAAGYQPFQMLMVQVGKPKLYTLLISAVFLVNLVLNMLLVPRLGNIGSAVGTALATIFSALMLKYLAKKTLKIVI